ncbi:hypothetical protein GLOIN_2v1581148 [Rhizophagus irregularis DAOM 181602=DAOM 197198]|nr:hypothetical protein GLOIN_2v1581148 [Rhizophagus irregularis DAOM 181602=DAOM 197198]
MIQTPDKNMNMFIDIKTSLFAIYLFLAGDSSALSNWSYAENPSKAEILAEIELFYLLPHQRRWQTWFPEVIHYYADADKTRVEIERLIEEGEWDNKEFIKVQEKLLEELQIKHNPIDNKIVLEKLSALEKLETSYHEKLEKLDKLETIEKSCEKLGKLDKLETLEKFYYEKLEKLEKLETLEKSYYEKLEKLEKLETLEKSYCEKSEKSDKLEILEKSHCEILEKLNKLETLEKSYCEKLDKLEKLNKIEKLLEEMNGK